MKISAKWLVGGLAIAVGAMWVRKRVRASREADITRAIRRLAPLPRHVSLSDFGTLTPVQERAIERARQARLAGKVNVLALAQEIGLKRGAAYYQMDKGGRKVLTPEEQELIELEKVVHSCAKAQRGAVERGRIAAFARERGLDFQTVYRAITRVTDNHRRREKEERIAIQEAAKAGMGAQEIADQLEANYFTIYDIITPKRAKRVRGLPKYVQRGSDTYNAIVDAHRLDKETRQAIADRLKVPRTAVDIVLQDAERAGLVAGKRAHISPAKREAIAQACRDAVSTGETSDAIARRFEVSDQTVLEICRGRIDSDPRRPETEKQETVFRLQAVKEKSRKEKDEEDYPKDECNEFFPVGCLVYVHRCQVMKVLGRCLARNEHVHHLDFDKQRNVPLNLALFNSSQEHMSYELTGTPAPLWAETPLDALGMADPFTAAKAAGSAKEKREYIRQMGKQHREMLEVLREKKREPDWDIWRAMSNEDEL